MWYMNYSQIMSPRPPLPRKVGGGSWPPAPMGAPPLSTWASNAGGYTKIAIFDKYRSFISKMIQDRTIVTMERHWELVCDLSNVRFPMTLSDLEWISKMFNETNIARAASLRQLTYCWIGPRIVDLERWYQWIQSWENLFSLEWA